ncbi:hypothetical protein [Sediminitomix flava]|uniref:GyrI-like small molecule binding domain-containing protein n=1 Tax=Sediminitomix flava TaxID=379075 RepID=A0A315ZFS4_SEDFL|nr:hypothetical protein [Sediminitomix flava]PWJ44436.1 hypothetical protein BC781_101796 [Sediminitomix flava]
MLDIEAIDPNYYNAKNTPEFISFDKKLYLSINGIGEPDHNEFQSKSKLLLEFAQEFANYALKEHQISFSIPRLETLWELDQSAKDKSQLHTRWAWKLLLRIPLKFKDSLISLFQSYHSDGNTSSVNGISIFEYEDGDCVQMLGKGHMSSNTDIPIGEMFRYIRQLGRRPKEFHHEIYLGKTPSDKTVIIRQPLH